jgi:uncharacterized protein YcbK (DUF882 family)
MQKLNSDKRMVSKFFSYDETKCPCCGDNIISDDLLTKLDKAREMANVPFKITSGYRCEKHNKEVGGKENSSHLQGLACDISCDNDTDRYKILFSLCSAGFTRIGIAKNFIHCDIDEMKNQKRIWTY